MNWTFQGFVRLAKVGPFALSIMVWIGGEVLKAQTADKAAVIAASVLPLPENLRAGATVVKVSADGKIQVLRKGTNSMVCRNTSAAATYSADCFDQKYFNLFEHARAVGRQIGAPDNGKQVAEVIEKEIKAGKLTLPEKPSVGFGLRGPVSGYNIASNTVNNEIESYQMIMVPFATGEAMSLPEQRTPGLPWVMAAGTWMAHIMIEH